MSSPIYTTGEMRAFDRAAAAGGTCSLAMLMREAGKAVAAAAQQLCPVPQRTFVLVGSGNNGGDALVAAALLHQRGYTTTLIVPGGASRLHPLPRQMFLDLPDGLRTAVQPCLPALPPPTPLTPPPLIIDGLLGTGYDPEQAMPPAMVQCITDANSLAVTHHARILSIDIPSGLNGDSGKEGAVCISADCTLTLVAAKPGLLSHAGLLRSGRLTVSPLPGMELLPPPALTGCRLFDYADAIAAWPAIARDTHKFLRGNVAVIGGSQQYCGAPLLSGTAALRAGAGLVTALLPTEAKITGQSFPKALILRQAPFSGHAPLAELLGRPAVIAIGPGMTTGGENAAFLRAVLDYAGQIQAKLVLDADALNLLAAHPELAGAIRTPAILTPHPGEFSRLENAYGLKAETNLHQRLRNLSSATRCCIVYKGPRMLVAPPSPSEALLFVNAGCPALATAGSGDVLTGTAAAILAQYGSADHLEVASALAAWLHATAGERLSAPRGSFGLIADDIPDEIAVLLRSLA